MNLHRLFGPHVPDPHDNHWEAGVFMSSCQTCGRAMAKLPGEKWKLVTKPR
jgi:hypothetical protein